MDITELVKKSFEGIDKDKEMNAEEKRVMKMITEESILSGFKRGVGEKQLKTKKEVLDHLLKLKYTKYFKSQTDIFWAIRRDARMKFSGDETIIPGAGFDREVAPEDPAKDLSITSQYGKCIECGTAGFVDARSKKCLQCKLGVK